MSHVLMESQRVAVHAVAWICAIKVSVSIHIIGLTEQIPIENFRFFVLAENTSIIDLDGSDKIVATTKVSIPQGDGPIQATSTIETVPSQLYPRIDVAEQPYEQVAKKSTPDPMVTPQRRSMKLQEEYPMPSAPPLQEVTNNPKLLLNLQGRQHEFSSRTVLRSESCAHCLKK